MKAAHLDLAKTSPSNPDWEFMVGRQTNDASEQGASLHLEHRVAADLVAVLAAVPEGEPRVMTVREGNALPSGPFEPGHRSLQSGLRAWVAQQTRHPLGYV